MSVRPDRGEAPSLPEVARRFTVRLAEPADELELRTLAALDSRALPTGAMLVAETGGRIQAAVPLAGGRAIANPFERTAELARVLELRAAQLRRQGFGDEGRRQRRRGHARLAGRLA